MLREAGCEEIVGLTANAGMVHQRGPEQRAAHPVKVRTLGEVGWKRVLDSIGRERPLFRAVLDYASGNQSQAAVILGIGYAFSTNRKAINWTTVGWGLGLQVVFAFIVLKTTIGQRVFEWIGGYITKLLAFSNVGAAFVFGPLGDASVWGRAMTGAIGPEGANYAVIFAFQILPTIIFIAALFAILYYFGIMQIVVQLFAVVMHRVMKASGAESLNVAASIFMGQTEAPLTIRPFLPEMTQSELMTVMPERQATPVISLRGLNSPASHFSNRSYPCDTAHPEKIGAVTVLHLGEH